MDMIIKAGLTEKAVRDGKVYLADLSNEDLYTLHDLTGQDVVGDSKYRSLQMTASTLQGSSFKDLDLISAPHDMLLPVTETEQLFIRESYQDLYDEITRKFMDSSLDTGTKRVIVTGTAGIGKSAFLVYFITRLLATSSEDGPPIIIFQERGSSKCYAYGGLTTVRFGDIEEFRPFLTLERTWYIVDSSTPLLMEARTIIAASTKTLYSDTLKEVEKSISWRYYMAPWDLEELVSCRTKVGRFKVLSCEAVEELFSKIGGVPRYVLEWPTKVCLSPTHNASP
jgi:hypothetical protein